ncbi:MAG: molybdopterin-dependent oxidoreductase [Sphingobium sp.]
MSVIATTCAYCGVGCGISATVTGERSVTIAGDKSHPANYGRLCSKGTHLGETVSLEGRLLDPMIGDRVTGWDEALDAVAHSFAETIAAHGPDSVAFYVSGQLLTEDYYVANKLMKGFIGSGNIDTNSRLCMSSAVAAHIRAFGEDVVPCSYDDIDTADLILLVGSNTAWCHPIIWQRIERARAARGTKLVVIDPRKTETAQQADLHIAIRPDGDVALFLGLLAGMRDRDMLDAQCLAQHVKAETGYIESLVVDCEAMGISEKDFVALADLAARHPAMLTLFSQGANQSTSGTDKGNAIINLHLATGRIGKPGAGPFSITGQPNAMGGREVGGLASTLAVHMGFSEHECDRAQRFWHSPTIARAPGLKAVDMFRAVHDGRIKAIWIMATNPAVSMPDAGFVREALAKCPLVVVSEVIADTDTTALAHIRLPALAWGEKDGTVTNSERIVSRQRALFSPPGQTRADWDIIADIGRRMGWEDSFAWTTSAQVFDEYCRQTAFENAPRFGMATRKLNLGERTGMSSAQFDALQPFRWGGLSPYADMRFTTPDGKARLVAVQPPKQPAADPAYPFRLNTARYRDQWHTMTRTGLSPKLSQHRREPLVEVNPNDGQARGLKDGGLARLSSPHGNSLFRIAFSDGQRRGELCVPMHWTDRTSSQGRTNLLPNQGADPLSGQPGFKNSAVNIEPFHPDWRAFMVSVERPNLPGDIYWTLVRQPNGWLAEMSGIGAVDIEAFMPVGERLEAFDKARGMRRIVVRAQDGTLTAALFLTRSGVLPAREWIVAQLRQADRDNGPALLAGRPAQPAPDCGPIVCVCFDIGMKTILGTIAEQRLTSVETVGKALNAGTNCGSCRPAIAQLLIQNVSQAA